MSEIVDIVPISKASDAFMPVMNIDLAVSRRDAIIQFVKRIMTTDQDFGVIPGTQKPTLLKPGAEKLCNFFGLEPEYITASEVMDWTGENHNGEPFYYIRYSCRLTRDGRTLGAGEGSCNSWESKYRYRNAGKKCPSCGQEAIIQGKPEYGGGWVCFKKKGGCGATFKTDNPVIADQKSGKVPNPDIADAINTIQKMAQKRALIAAALIATSASEFFTQDIEDMGHPSQEPEPPQAAPDPPPSRAPKAPKVNPDDPAELVAYLERISTPLGANEVKNELRNRLYELGGQQLVDDAYTSMLEGNPKADVKVRRLYAAILSAQPPKDGV